MCGPDTPELAEAAVEGGADLVELGFPFSDPLADGPVIRKAAERALAQGMRTAACLECLAAVRERVDVPLVPMTYAALLEAYGYERFAADAEAAGATSLIVADLPAGERPDLRRIQLVAPTSPDERLRLAADSSDGWLYLVTLTGTTGAREYLSPSFAGLVSRARAITDLPLYAGFGIAEPEQARDAAELADGVVVGSRAVEVAEEGPDAAARLRPLPSNCDRQLRRGDNRLMRIFSGIKPTGDATFGNYSGGFRQYALTQEQGDAFFCIVDLHAVTVEHDPGELRTRTLDLAAMLFATGLDPERSTVFVQSHVKAHAEAAWLLSAATSYGQLGRMTQFKEKGARRDFVSAALFNYPILMAGDILLYEADAVPIGDDQRQHLELARDIADRFNTRFGETFKVPEGIYPEIGARIMDLQEPDGQDGQDGLERAGQGADARRPRGRAQEVQDRRHRFRDRGAARPGGKGGRLEPDRDHGRGDGQFDRRGRVAIQRRGLREVQGGRGRSCRRGARPDPGALPSVARRRGRAAAAPGRRRRQGPRGERADAGGDVRPHGVRPSVASAERG